MNNLGQVYEDKDDFRTAEKYYRDGLAILEENKLGESWSAARIETNIGFLAMDRGEYADAERYAVWRWKWNVNWAATQTLITHLR